MTIESVSAFSLDENQKLPKHLEQWKAEQAAIEQVETLPVAYCTSTEIKGFAGNIIVVNDGDQIWYDC